MTANYNAVLGPAAPELDSLLIPTPLLFFSFAHAEMETDMRRTMDDTREPWGFSAKPNTGCWDSSHSQRNAHERNSQHQKAIEFFLYTAQSREAFCSLKTLQRPMGQAEFRPNCFPFPKGKTSTSDPIRVFSLVYVAAVLWISQQEVFSGA